ncbi:hypothetical protein J4G07_22365, partial [Candidatus Poribacteria bacterium]|nr:hypothetical protein [Candidatus Poribacteria bacterium]
MRLFLSLINDARCGLGDPTPTVGRLPVCLSSVTAIACLDNRWRCALNWIWRCRVQVLLARFFLAAGAVQSNRFTAKIGGCCVWDFPVFGAIDHYIVNSNF